VERVWWQDELSIWLYFLSFFRLFLSAYNFPLISISRCKFLSFCRKWWKNRRRRGWCGGFRAGRRRSDGWWYRDGWWQYCRLLDRWSLIRDSFLSSFVLRPSIVVVICCHLGFLVVVIFLVISLIRRIDLHPAASKYFSPLAVALASVARFWVLL